LLTSSLFTRKSPNGPCRVLVSLLPACLAFVIPQARWLRKHSCHAGECVLGAGVGNAWSNSRSISSNRCCLSKSTFGRTNDSSSAGVIFFISAARSQPPRDRQKANPSKYASRFMLLRVSPLHNRREFRLQAHKASIVAARNSASVFSPSQQIPLNLLYM
jgi:hypothetical protein